LEVNPRPGATLDIFDAPPGLFGLHVAACAGRLERGWRAPPGAAASAIAYADRRLQVHLSCRGFQYTRQLLPPSPDPRLTTTDLNILLGPSQKSVSRPYRAL